MTLLHRYTLKDSKKSSFTILRFLYDLLWFSKVSTNYMQIGKRKGKTLFHGVPAYFLNLPAEQLLLFIWVMHYALKPLKDFLFLRVVLLLLPFEQSRVGHRGQPVLAGGWLSGGERRWWSITVPARTERSPQLAPRQPDMAWPHAPVATVVAALATALRRPRWPGKGRQRHNVS